MPAMFILAAAAMGFVLAALAVVVAGIRQEPSAQALTRQAPRLMARFARRMAGLHVRSPDPPAVPVSSARDRAKQHTIPVADRKDTPGTDP
jgi:hypothetical protein